jgi:integrase
VLRLGHYSRRTKESYVGWIRRYILFHGKRHPATMGGAEIVAFLTHLATGRQVSASTQNQALNAILFLLTRDEVRSVMRHLAGVPWIVACLLYGAGLRLLECRELRVKDLDFERRQVWVRRGKGAKDRVVPLPVAVVPRLTAQLKEVRAAFEGDRRLGIGTMVPDAIQRKIRTRLGNGRGSSSSRPGASVAMPAGVRRAVSISTRRRFSASSRARSEPRA